MGTKLIAAKTWHIDVASWSPNFGKLHGASKRQCRRFVSKRRRRIVGQDTRTSVQDYADYRHSGWIG